MSGTSLDGVDAAAIQVNNAAQDKLCEIIATQFFEFPAELKTALRALNQNHTASLEQIAQLDKRLGDAFADAVLGLLDTASMDRNNIAAIGSHGQTIWHQPPSATAGENTSGVTWQLGDPNIIVARTGVTTVADFRRADIAAGGHGAPLASLFHAVTLRVTDETRVVLNLGGMANITLLPAMRSGADDITDGVIGFDTGPANALLDQWSAQQFALEYDAHGKIAAGGRLLPELLARLLEDPYFDKLPPKSTGPEYFNVSWLQAYLQTFEASAPADVLHTLTALTATSVTQAVARNAPTAQRVIVCGGGVHNHELMRQLAEQMPQLSVESSAAFGLDPDFIEAAAFAWLASRRLLGQPGNLPNVTGARQSVLLGGVYRA